jgi:hypothetical protein
MYRGGWCGVMIYYGAAIKNLAEPLKKSVMENIY